MTYYDDQTRQEWTGAIVCHGAGTRGCWEPRHPVDFIRSSRDLHGVQDARLRGAVDANGTTIAVGNRYWVDGYAADDYTTEI